MEIFFSALLGGLLAILGGISAQRYQDYLRQKNKDTNRLTEALELLLYLRSVSQRDAPVVKRQYQILDNINKLDIISKTLIRRKHKEIKSKIYKYSSDNKRAYTLTNEAEEKLNEGLDQLINDLEKQLKSGSKKGRGKMHRKRKVGIILILIGLGIPLVLFFFQEDDRILLKSPETIVVERKLTPDEIKALKEEMKSKALTFSEFADRQRLDEGI